MGDERGLKDRDGLSWVTVVRSRARVLRIVDPLSATGAVHTVQPWPVRRPHNGGVEWVGGGVEAGVADARTGPLCSRRVRDRTLTSARSSARTRHADPA